MGLVGSAYGAEWDSAVGAYRGLRRRIWTANAMLLSGYLIVHVVAIWVVVRAAHTCAIELNALATVIPAIITVGMTGSGGDGFVLRGLSALRALRTMSVTMARRDPRPFRSMDVQRRLHYPDRSFSSA